MTKSLFNQHRRGLIAFIVLLSFSLVVWNSCAEQQFPTEPQEESEVLLKMDNPEVQNVMAIQDRHTDQLMSIAGVVGTATTMTDDGRPAIMVMTETRRVRADNTSMLPADLEGIPVVELVTGPIRAIKGPPGSGEDPTGTFRPLKIGVSLGHPDITAGTLGCFVTKGGSTYILSNNQ